MIPQDAGFPDPNNVPPSRREDKPVAGRIESARRAALMEEQAVPAALSSAPDMGTFLRALRRRWIAAAALGGSLAIVAALAAWFLLSPKYIAFGRVRVAYETPTIGLAGQTGGQGNFLTTLKTQAAQITSRPVIWSALKRDELKRLNLESTGKDPAQYIEEELKVEFQDNQELLTITMGASESEVSLAVVKAIMDSYMDDIVYSETRAHESRVAELDKVFTASAASLKQKRDSLKEMTKKSGIPDPQLLSLHLNELQSRIRDATTQQNGIRLELVKAQADLASHKARISALKDPTISLAALEAALKADTEAQRYQGLISRYQDVVTDFEEKTPGQQWPTLVAAKSKIKNLQVKLDKRKKELQEDLAKHAGTFGAGGREEMELARVQKENQISALEQLHKKLDGEIKELNGQLAEVKVADHEQDSLRDAIHQEELLVNDLAMKLKKEQVELHAAPRISKFQDAELQKKDMKKQILGTLVAPVVMLLAVCMALAWTEVRHRRIRSAGEVSGGLGIRIIGAVPSLPNFQRHLIDPAGEPDLEGHPALESIDALRTQLLRDADAEATRVVMVTSATRGEGKTTVASHLASSLARAGRRTLLIDGDLRAPSAHQLFELPMQPGFSEVALGEVELTDAIQATTLDGLSFMAAGQWDREVLQALARDGLEGIFEKLQEEFDFVVIDSHPVLPATDSLLIGQRVDAVILSVLREVSQMPRVYAASQRLTTLGIRVLGAVVNGADPEEALAATASARLVAH